MAFKIIGQNEPEIISTINILIYGEPGIGKTSLGFTSAKPILFDCEKGSHRSEFKKDRIKITNWQKDYVDNQKTIAKDLEDYETVIIDTVEGVLKLLGAWIINNDSKYSMLKYQLQWYGVMKKEYEKFINVLNSLGKDVIGIAHAKQLMEGDLKIKIPKITGGTYDNVLDMADFVAYYYMTNDDRTLDFNPTEFHIGKNSAKFSILKVPDFAKKPEYFSDIILQMKKSMGELASSQSEAVEIVAGFTDLLNNVKKAKDINDLMQSMSEQQPIIKAQLWKLIKEKAKELNFEFHDAEKIFYAKEKEVKKETK